MPAAIVSIRTGQPIEAASQPPAPAHGGNAVTGALLFCLGMANGFVWALLGDWVLW